MIVSDSVPPTSLAFIDRESLTAECDFDPWDEFAFRHFASHPRNKILVAAYPEHAVPIGYCACSFLHDRIQVVRIVVLPHLRRRNIATNMLMSLISQAALQNRGSTVIAEVPETNFAAIKMFQNSGFKAVEIVKTAGCEDCYLFQFERRKPPLEPGNRLTKSKTAIQKLKDLWNRR